MTGALATLAAGVVLLAGGAVAYMATHRAARWYLRRWARRTLLRVRTRTDRDKLTQRARVIAQVLEDPAVADAVRAHAAQHGEPEEATWRRARRYLQEIVPFFSILAYYRLGYWVSRAALGLFYKVTVTVERPDPFRDVPRDATVIYLMNHRSNADYVLVSYVLLGRVAISWAVGEWARAFPLELLFKSFGSYFIRRRHREPLYHAVLRGYVERVTRGGVTQGIFPEGGLTRDGALRPAKIGLLDYALGAARDPAVRRRLVVVPVGINYDRVLEDRSLLRELESRTEARGVGIRVGQAWEVGRFLLWNVGRLFLRRWRRYGQAAVTIGAPIPVAPWLDAMEAEGTPLHERPREARLPVVQQWCDEVMARVGQLVPVTPVPLACAALQSFDAEFVTREALLERMAAMRDVLREGNASVLRADRDIGETWERAERMLRLRRMVVRTGRGYLLLPRGRPLVTYYANSIVHLLGPYADGVRARDALPLHDWEREERRRG
ncbi:MAG: 1-acyl-sn-glycerol-3-phosphate acyltransferase [Gemmatimonadetes bacterium]|nr:1-acyl-sn-glycerol-3-phosphate acyltransferase [Gemmatimonadota bacterium]